MMLIGFSGFLKFALYPYENTRKLQSPSSLMSHPGQKTSGLRSQDHVFNEDPPRPWTKMTSALGFDDP